MRHGYGVRTSAPFGKASKYRGQKAIRGSLTSLRSSEPGAAPLDAAEKRDRRVDDSRGGFVLQSKSTEQAAGRRRSLGSGNIKKNLFRVSVFERNFRNYIYPKLQKKNYLTLKSTTLILKLNN